MNGRAVRFKTRYSKGKGRFKSRCGWFEQLDEEFGVWKGKDGRILCKVDYYQCGVEAAISSRGWMQLRYNEVNLKESPNAGIVISKHGFC